MSDRYKGAILSPTAPTVTSQSAGGIYTLSQQTQYQGQGVWPTAVNYPINNSLRFRASASAYLNRTPASATNRKTWTFSAWVKRGKLASNNTIFNAGYPTVSWFAFIFGNNDTLQIAQTAGSSAGWSTAAVFRDPSAWYHVVCVIDTTSATSTITNTATDRIRLYVNNVQQSLSGGTVPTQNSDLQVNNTISHTIGGYSAEYFDGYMAETNFIDGTALTPSSFGTTDAYGIWQPIPYTGSYGTNGFYLPFTDNSALTTSSNVGLGKDFSGNGNYWTTNGISITAGSTYDSMKDVPTNTNSNTANYSVLNPLDIPSSTSLTNGNLLFTNTAASAWKSVTSTISFSSGKFYCEFTSTNATIAMAGIVRSSWNANIADSRFWADSLGYSYYSVDGQKYNNGSSASYGATYTINDIIGIALDLNVGTLEFYKNGVSQGTAYTGLVGTFKFCAGVYDTTSACVFNFGQRPFSYTPPTGFLPLNTYNLPTPTILDGDQYFNATTYTGTGSTQSIVNSGAMQPDWVWIKNRSSANSHQLTDSVRGVNLALASDLTIAEFTGNINAFNTNGFQLTGATNAVNASGQTYVAWQWRASNAAGVSNTQGTITSTVSANTTAGFSIATFTSPSSGTASFGHGLGVTPSFVIVKSRASGNWICQHTSTGAQYLLLNGTGAAVTDSTVWNSAFTSTVVNIGTGFAGTVNYVAYCFSAVAGYSAFGSYTGNGSTDGPFVYLGFRPRFFMTKCTSSTSDWHMTDTARYPTNSSTSMGYLDANTTAADANFNIYDGLSNGFKVRDNGSQVNGSGATYIYMAFAENPFKISRAR